MTSRPTPRELWIEPEQIYIPAQPSPPSPEDAAGFIGADPALNAIADVKRWSWKAKRIKVNGQRMLDLMAVFQTPTDERLAVQGMVSLREIQWGRGRITRRLVEALIEKMLTEWRRFHPSWRGMAVCRRILHDRFKDSLSPKEKDHDPPAGPPAS